MRTHVMASSAGSTQRQANGFGRFFRGVGGTRGRSRYTNGSGVSVARSRTALLAVIVSTLLLVPASQAFGFGTVTVEKSGLHAAESTITSDPVGIDCGAACSFEFGIFSHVSLTANPAPGAGLESWSGAECEGGQDSNPCNFTVPFTFEMIVTATFGLPPDPPIATTGGTSAAGEHLATLEGKVNPQGSKVANCHFEYGTTTSYGRSRSCTQTALGSGSDDVAASTITGVLQAGTTYHYRLVASNGGGTSNGDDQTFTTAPTADSCPNAAIRAEQGSDVQVLPDCMALEMVSPPKKYLAQANHAVFSPTGDRLVFVALAALADTPGLQYPNGDYYVASRGASGWTTTPTSAPASAELFRSGGDNGGGSYTFAPDLGHWAITGGTLKQAQIGRTAYYLGGVDNSFLQLSPLLIPTDTDNGLGSSHGSSLDVTRSEPVATSSDLTAVVFDSGSRSYSYLPGDPTLGNTGNVGLFSNTYVAFLDESGLPTLELLSRDMNGTLFGGRCGSVLGNGNRFQNQGAISSGAKRIYFTTRLVPPNVGCDLTSPKRIMKRVLTPEGPAILPLISSECNRMAPACDTANGDENFVAASTDGTKVYFTTTRQLSNSDLDVGSECGVWNAANGCDLYLYDSTRPPDSRLTQVSAGDSTDASPGSGANVFNSGFSNGVVSVSGDGSHVYFVAEGVLTTHPNTEGAVATTGQRNLYSYERDDAHPDGHLAFIGTAVQGDEEGEQGLLFNILGMNSAFAVPENGSDGEVGAGDGHILVFGSKAPFTADDTDGFREDVFRYDSDTEELVRISRAPVNGRDNGPFDVRVNPAKSTDFPLEDRWVSEDGDTIGFLTGEQLVPGDDDAAENPYFWKKGELARIAAPVTYVFLTRPLPSVSPDGREIGFSTTSPLLPSDGDSAEDVYIARVDGGFTNPVPPVICEGETCQGSDSRGAKPPTRQMASSSFQGSGNVKESVAGRCPKARHKGRRKGKVRCVRRGPKRAGQQQRAGRNQGGQR